MFSKNLRISKTSKYLITNPYIPINSNPKTFNFLNFPEKRNFSTNIYSNIYENAYTILKNKSHYLSTMEKSSFFCKNDIEKLRNTKNNLNLLFGLKFFDTHNFHNNTIIKDFYYLYKMLDDEFILIFFKKILKSKHLKFIEDIDKVFEIIIIKGFRDFEILNSIKELIIINSDKLSYINIGNILLFCDRMSILTNDTNLKSFYSDFITTGLIKLNYNDLLYSFDALGKIKNVDNYIWQIIQFFIVKKFNKLYKINSLKRLSQILSAKNIYDTIFCSLTDKYLFYNFDKITGSIIMIEILANIKKMLGKTSVSQTHMIRLLNQSLSRRKLKELKIVILALRDGGFILYKDKKVSEHDNSVYLQKAKNYFKNSMDEEVDKLEYENISFLIDEELHSEFNTSLLTEKTFLLMINKIESFSVDEKFRIYFEFGKYDKRFIKHAEKININCNSSGNINLQINEFNFLLIIRYLKKYQNEENENINNLLEILIENFNDILKSDLEIKYYQLLIMIIPYYKDILKDITSSVKKEKLNKIINTFMVYKNNIFLENYSEKKYLTAVKDNKEFLRKFNFDEEREFDFDKLIIIKILNELNPKKLGLDSLHVEMFENSHMINVDISKSYLLQIISLFYNFSFEDLQGIYNMEFNESKYYDYIKYI